MGCWVHITRGSQRKTARPAMNRLKAIFMSSTGQNRGGWNEGIICHGAPKYSQSDNEAYIKWCEANDET